MKSVQIEFLGHASFKFTAPGGEVIYFDPWITDNPVCTTTLEDITAADIVCVSHGHVDHLGEAIEIVKQTGATLIGSPEVAGYATTHGIGFETDSCPLNIGGSARLGSVRYTMVQAHHSTGMHGIAYRDGSAYAEPDGSVCGYVLDFDDGPIIYNTTDTGVFGDMALISQMYAPDLAIMPVGGKYTMGVKEAAVAASLIRPRAVIPCHYDTFPNQAADIGELRRRIDDLTPRTEVLEMKPGDTLSYP
ncbi:MAG TPA: metal-dependent hydrolase [Chloroflexota bacterium]|nr:metal-dependent hydrolase [Chloroflexota bacterium]